MESEGRPSAPRGVVRGQPVAREKLEIAKILRGHMTVEEVRVWMALRGNKLGGLHFRRQQVIAGFIVDFYCDAARLALEIDGSVHDMQHSEDAARDQALADRGIATMRFPNDMIARDLPGVLAAVATQARRCISAALAAEAPPLPSPRSPLSPTRIPASLPEAPSTDHVRSSFTLPARRPSSATEAPAAFPSLPEPSSATEAPAAFPLPYREGGQGVR